MNLTLIYIGAALPALWGVAHLFPTGSVVKGFGDITTDNRRIVAMEWITEGVALIGLGALVAATTTVDPNSPAAQVVYVLSACTLFVLAVVSLFTGFRIDFLPFRMCPFIFTTSGLMILAGAAS